jgi:hypothetical protein
MKKLITTILLVASICSGAEFNAKFSDLETMDWTAVGGNAFHMLWSQIGAVSVINYPDVPQYSATDRFEFTSFTAGGSITNTGGSGLEMLTNGASGAAMTSVALTNGVSAHASLDGTSDLANGSRFSYIESAEKLTISLWLEPSSAVAFDDSVFSKYTDANNYFQIRVSGGDLTNLEIVPEGNDTGSAITTNGGHIVGVMSHHVFVIDLSVANGITYYYNGIESGLSFSSFSATSMTASANNIQLGALSGGFNYGGAIDTLTTWSETALTANEVYNLSWGERYNNPDNGLDIGGEDEEQINPGKGWIGFDYTNRNETWYQAQDLYWSMNEELVGLAQNVHDLSFNGRTGSTQGGGFNTANSESSISNGVGKPTESAYVETDVGTTMDGVTNLFFAAWVMRGSLRDSSGIMMKYNGTQQYIAFGLGNASNGGNNDLFLSVRNINNGICHTTNDVMADTGVWHHVAYRFNGAGATDTDRIKLWVNGVEQVLTIRFAFPTSTPVTSGNLRICDFSLGSNWGADLDGYIDDVRMVWGDDANDFITAEIVTNIYNGTKATYGH